MLFEILQNSYQHLFLAKKFSSGLHIYFVSFLQFLCPQLLVEF
jgi:hypothetical protein